MNKSLGSLRGKDTIWEENLDETRWMMIQREKGYHFDYCTRKMKQTAKMSKKAWKSCNMEKSFSFQRRSLPLFLHDKFTNQNFLFNALG